MRLGEYLYSKAVTLCFLALGGVMMGACMAAAGGGVYVLPAAVLYLLLIAGWLLTGFMTERSRIRRLSRILREVPCKYLLAELLPEPVNALERQYFDIMRTVSRSAVGVAEQSLREKEEYCQYVECWVHEMKTPLTACSLILSNDADIRKLRRELKKADNLTETILYYARLRTAEKDTQIRQFFVRPVLDEAVKSQMELLTAAGIRVEVNGDFAVHSDAKAVTFMVKQLLINCAKYCPGCRVEIRAAEGRICVRDDGPGIPAHELARVAERGFTGSAGRREQAGTGMGLYLVKELCRRLEMELTADSRPGEYTEFCLSFLSLTKL